MMKLRSLLIVLAIPVLLWIAAMVVAFRWELPDPVATHFGADGMANGFASLGSQTLILSAVLALNVGGSSLVVLRRPVRQPFRAIFAGLSVGLTAFVTTIYLVTLGVQRGLGSAVGASLSNWHLLLALAAGLATGAVAGLLIPTAPQVLAAQGPAADSPRVPLAAGEVAVWTKRAGMAPSGVGVVLVIGVLLLVCAIITQLWLLAIVAVLVGAVFWATALWTVTVDSRGLRYRSALGWPSGQVDLAEMVEASVTTVRPLAEFGGWGIRMDSHGRTGLVLRAGEALQVRTADGGAVVVTVDDATGAAGLLNSLVDRRQVGAG